MRNITRLCWKWHCTNQLAEYL